jgi:hypothetical protein
MAHVLRCVAFAAAYLRLAYVGNKPGGYDPFQFEDGGFNVASVEFTDDMFVIKGEVASGLAEEKRGLSRWLRIEFRNASGAKAATQERLAATDEPEQTAPQPAAAAPWPKKLADRIGAIRDLVTKAPAAWSVEMVAGAFRGANKGDVEEVLDSLPAAPLANAEMHPSALRRETRCQGLGFASGSSRLCLLGWASRTPITRSPPHQTRPEGAPNPKN